MPFEIKKLDQSNNLVGIKMCGATIFYSTVNAKKMDTN